MEMSAKIKVLIESNKRERNDSKAKKSPSTNTIEESLSIIKFTA